MGVDRERGSDHNQRSAIARRSDSLLYRQAAYSLDRNRDGAHHFAQTIEGRGRTEPTFTPQRPHVVANVVNDVIATELSQLFGSLDRIGHGHIVPHHLY